MADAGDDDGNGENRNDDGYDDRGDGKNNDNYSDNENGDANDEDDEDDVRTRIGTAFSKMALL